MSEQQPSLHAERNETLKERLDGTHQQQFPSLVSSIQLLIPSVNPASSALLDPISLEEGPRPSENCPSSSNPCLVSACHSGSSQFSKAVSSHESLLAGGHGGGCGSELNVIDSSRLNVEPVGFNIQSETENIDTNSCPPNAQSQAETENIDANSCPPNAQSQAETENIDTNSCLPNAQSQAENISPPTIPPRAAADTSENQGNSVQCMSTDDATVVSTKPTDHCDPDVPCKQMSSHHPTLSTPQTLADHEEKTKEVQVDRSECGYLFGDKLSEPPQDVRMDTSEENTAIPAHGSQNPVEGVVYDFSNRNVPSFVTWARTEFVATGHDNFLRGCKWSPDGQKVLTNSNDNSLRVFDMSSQITDNEASSCMEQMSALFMREGGTIYDFAWHPESSWIASACPGIPIHLWQAGQGKIVSNYKAFDQYDEVTAAYSVSFNHSGELLFGGYKKAIRIFHTEYPSRKCRLIKTTAAKKSFSQPSQSGILSSFSHHPASPDVFAAGSYSRQVGMYDLRCNGPTCVMDGQRGGITQLMFSRDGNWLLTGARKDKEILCWDVRNLGNILFTALRDVGTNQRMQFDITSCGRYMTSGNDNGTVTFWDLQRSVEVIHERPYLRPVGQFRAHDDSVNGVSFHPEGRLVASASGQRHFRSLGSESSSDEESDSGRRSKPRLPDFSLRIWRVPCVKADL